MDVWRFMQILLIVATVSGLRNSDPMDHSLYTIFDESLHVPGEPLCPLDYQNAQTVSDVPPLNDGEHTDPIELAGLFEGDIVLSTSKTINETDDTRNGIIYEKQKWPGGVVPYFISSEFNAVERSVIAKAIGEYHSKTCIKFVPRKSESDYIHITKGSGCSSHVGRTGGAQQVSLGVGCAYTGIAIHELMHAVGFWHEQSRWDRDNYVSVYFQNIQSGMEFNFRKYNWDYIQNLSAPYDLGSVMHYSAFSFSKDRKSATILPKDPSQKIGQRNGFSKIDMFKINKLYKCGTNNGGTTTTPAPKPTNKPPVDKCEDHHQHCAYWASKGECSKNGVWMLVNCRKSCSQCRKPCRDLNAQCGIWARNGDCTKTSQKDYMKSYCTKSCKSCRNGDNGPQVTLPSVLSTKPPQLPWVPPTSGHQSTTSSPNLECEDKEKFCQYWASKGECTKNPKFMGKYCPKSCKICM